MQLLVYRLYKDLSENEFDDLPDWMKPFRRIQVFDEKMFQPLCETLYENNIAQVLELYSQMNKPQGLFKK